MKALSFRSFGARLLVFMLGLLLFTQASLYLLVNAANLRNAREQVARDLELGLGVFTRLIDERSAALINNARLLSSDFAFKRTYANGDAATIVSAMENHLGRIEADSMHLLDLDGELIASTEDIANPRGSTRWDELMLSAEINEYGEASGLVMVAGTLQQMTVVPLFTPDHSAWVLIGFVIDDRFARELGKISQVSVMAGGGSSYELVATTQDRLLAQELIASLLASPPLFDRASTRQLAGEAYVTLVTPLPRAADSPGVAVLLRPLAEELAPYEDLRRYLGLLFVIGLAISLVAAIWIARSVTRPVSVLSAGVSRIAAGDYAGRVDLVQRDELGELASAFNQMASGLEERERVRNLLGKVVSPEVAEELLNRELELGGEEREVSVLFADVRNFTTLCEDRAPREILELLNRYLTRVTGVIEAHGGVVDKYVGDAVMALFGAPLQHADDARRAVASALAMIEEVRALNLELKSEGLQELAIGIGVNTATVVAGNMGSASRLNYTVIGDGVNLASRLEGLTKNYETDILVSAATAQAAPGFDYEALGEVTVKGKMQAVAIFSPLARAADPD